MRTPIMQFAKDEKVSLRFLYKEANAKRLVLTKVGSRTFVEDSDAERWHALAPKIGNPGEIALRTAVQAIEALGRAVSQGHIDQAVAARTMREVAMNSGVNRVAA
jgi:hypothetical protein